MVSARVHAYKDLLGHDWFSTLGARVIYVPVAWFNLQSVAFNSKARDALALYTFEHIKLGLFWGGIVLAVLSTMLLFAWCTKFYQRRKREWGWRASSPAPL